MKPIDKLPLTLSVVTDPRRLAALADYEILDTPAERGYDDIVYLACRLCSVPVALVSLVAADRQWFKARVGFPACQTDLDSSVCAHALAQPDELLIIDDLTLDERTAANPLVTGEPFIRFYAGAPLRTPDGLVLGSLCVIDGKPRPGGLDAAQAEDLRALARQVETQLELRRAVAVRDALRADEAQSFHAREALRDTQSALATNYEREPMLEAIVRGAMRAVPSAEGGVVEVIVGDMLEYDAVHGSLVSHRGLRVPLQGSLAGHCATTMKALRVDDVTQDPHVKKDLVAKLNMKAAVLAPITRSDDVLGVLKLQSSHAAAFSDRDLDQVKLFAAVASVGLAQAEARQKGRDRETFWRSLFERFSEGVIVGEVI